MKIGLIADVRGLVAPLRAALHLLAEEGCERIACLGSTVEGGADDEEALRILAEASVVIVPSPHDAPGQLDAWPPTAQLAGLELAHEIPNGSDEMLWLTSCQAPSLLQTMTTLGSRPGQYACGDLYVPFVTMLPESGAAARRVFIGPGAVTIPAGSFIACPGSVTMSIEGAHGGGVATWDDASREFRALTFGPDGVRLPARRPSILVYCDALGDMTPDDNVLANIRFTVKASADDIRADVEELAPDVVIMDYHLGGTMTGIDALQALRQGRDRLPAPVLSMAGDPSCSEGLKAAGAVSALPYVYLKDTLSRLILELTG